MSAPTRADLIYDWNDEHAPSQPIQLDDETLRDGLQSPSARDPELDEKLELIHLMDGLGIDTADVGLPGASPRAREHILALCREMTGLAITPNVACRTLVSDIAPAAEVQQEVGAPLEVCAFIGSSPIRQYAESWELETMLGLVHEAISFCTAQGLTSMFVTEDTTRAHPDTVRALYATAIEAGATRIHATAMGVGERTGNTEMDLLLVNLRLLGWIERDLTKLGAYVRKAADYVGMPVPPNYPVFGKDAFETSTGVHAAAVIKAFKLGDAWLANRVYSGVPADLFGLEQVIAVGPMSGRSNVAWVLKKHRIEPTDERIQRVLDKAKATPRQLTDAEVLEAAR